MTAVTIEYFSEDSAVMSQVIRTILDRKKSRLNFITGTELRGNSF